MPYTLDDKIVIAVSTTALFDFSAEHEVFVNEGIEKYLTLQRELEDTPPAPGTAFGLIKALLGWNKYFGSSVVEVIIASQNSPDSAIRIQNAIEHYGLEISRSVYTSGNPLIGFLKKFNTSLYLSTNQENVQAAHNVGIPSGLVYPPPKSKTGMVESEIVRLAFDGDAVLVSDEAESVCQEQGLEAFFRHELEHRGKPLPAGPMTSFLKLVSDLQYKFPNDKCPVLVGLFTTRNSTVLERVIRSFRESGLRVDVALFLGGVTKSDFLEVFDPHIFFDDQRRHTDLAALVVPTAQVLGMTQMKDGE